MRGRKRGVESEEEVGLTLVVDVVELKLSVLGGEAKGDGGAEEGAKEGGEGAKN